MRKKKYKIRCASPTDGEFDLYINAQNMEDAMKTLSCITYKNVEVVELDDEDR